MKRHRFTCKEYLCLLFGGEVIKLLRCDVLAKIIDALEPLAVMDHQLAGEPHVEQRQGGILASAIIPANPVPVQVPVSQWTTRSQIRAHLLEQFWIG